MGRNGSVYPRINTLLNLLLNVSETAVLPFFESELSDKDIPGTIQETAQKR